MTQILEVSSRIKRAENATSENSSELSMLMNYDFEYGFENICENVLEYVENELEISKDPEEKLAKTSMTYLAALVEEKVIRQIKNKRSKACLRCMYVFTENDLTNDSLISFKSKSGHIFQPCKSTLNIILCVEKFLKKFENQTTSFGSMLTHIMDNVDVSLFYVSSVFDNDHDHQYDIVKSVITAYLDIKSTKASKILTRLSHEQLIRHEQLKRIHRSGQ